MSADGTPTTEAGEESVVEHLRESILTGVAITVPLVVTVYVLTALLDFIVEALAPFIDLLRYLGVIQALESARLIVFLVDIGVYSVVVDFLTELIAVAILLGFVVVVGTVGHNRYGEHIVDVFDFVIASIPGVGTVYKSFRRMGDVMLGDEGENFQEVKLVQCFGENVYVIGFKTTDSPKSVENSAGHDEMVSMFLPLAPNPVTGGFLTYIPTSQVHDIDMTVDEAVRSILTSGVATGPGADSSGPITLNDIQEVTNVDPLGRDDDAPTEAS
jgi:uncharacterized membrane protein